MIFILQLIIIYIIAIYRYVIENRYNKLKLLLINTYLQLTIIIYFTILYI